MINPKIFKAYDIRGLYPSEIDEETAYQIGQAFIGFLNKKGGLNNRQIVVGRDMRVSSDDLFEALTQSLMSRSFDVIDIGRCSTPLFYWALISERAAGGVMITASHNPRQYNGFKLYGAEAWPIGETSGMQDIKALAMKEMATPIAALPGRVVKKDIMSGYLAYVKSRIDLKKLEPFKIVADCGNGMIGPELTELLKVLPGQIRVLFSEPDGTFPNHEANPIKEENLVALKQAVKEAGADFGVAFDGDGDRLTFVDEKGESVRGDFITALIAEELLKTSPGQKIFYEIRSSRAVPEAIVAAGGMPILGRAGHTLIKMQMRREDILFGGELSGHYFFKDLGFVDSALLPLLMIWEVLGVEQKTLSAIVAPFKKYYHSGEINFSVADADKIIEAVVQRFSDGQIKRIDGITIEYPDWWFNLRKSNTEPLVRLNMEADTAELLEEKKQEIIGLIK
ncbi:MAG TPA: phosphomannomutase/phosphoglucomutase [Candidatus Portnoybacteria bacterium]|uniref:Phosphomannomutase/phosphoglucomutase n=1 Tax=Candidatus Portnoybacteria bacterium CG02_land_8_20_14_3_00_45_8 TaxID=1974807 RepID=A0A2M7D6K2_9BACT|nr:MAG: phosphomannomutase/phosphoglucomutase [Candidatus Portnoybacteria bacterium CG02_land_8_20_14_3_00_45_8]HCX27987.1 phosphomannomutase/phosphoglucomutase [Candidatus Portnoybacteria bacterium]